jgi:hypothetical protein
LAIESSPLNEGKKSVNRLGHGFCPQVLNEEGILHIHSCGSWSGRDGACGRKPYTWQAIESKADTRYECFCFRVRVPPYLVKGVKATEEGKRGGPEPSTDQGPNYRLTAGEASSKNLNRRSRGNELITILASGRIARY